jgi:hypothetical protein
VLFSNIRFHIVSSGLFQVFKMANWDSNIAFAFDTLWHSGEANARHHKRRHLHEISQ